MKRILLLPLAALGCAEMALPPGGPIDETPPLLVSTRPPDGATGVDPRQPIEIIFSEPVSGAEAAFEIRPDPGAVEVEEHGRRVRVRAALDSARTYELGFSEQLADLHGVRLAQPLSWAISTASVIESGRLAGRVFEGIGSGAGAAGVTVALLELDGPEPAATPLHWIRPLYRVASDAEGRWEMGHLPQGEWRVIAYQDENGNGRCEPGREPAAAYWRPVSSGDSTEVRLVLSEPHERPTQIVDGRFLHRGLVELRIDEALLPGVEPAVRIDGSEVGGRIVPAGTRLFVEVDSVAGLVTLEIEGLPDGFPERPEPPWIELEASQRLDTRPPALLASTIDSTGGAVPPRGETWLVFGEPLAASSRRAPGDSLVHFELGDSTGERVSVSATRWVNSAILALRFALPDTAALHGFLIPGPALVDPAGNRADFELACRLPARDQAADLAGAVVGVKPRAEPAMVLVSSGGRTVARRLCDAGGAFRIEGLAPGIYALAAFEDRDGDGAWDGADPRGGEGGEPVVIVELELLPGESIEDLELVL